MEISYGHDRYHPVGGVQGEPIRVSGCVLPLWHVFKRSINIDAFVHDGSKVPMPNFQSGFLKGLVLPLFESLDQVRCAAHMLTCPYTHENAPAL